MTAATSVLVFIPAFILYISTIWIVGYFFGKGFWSPAPDTVKKSGFKTLD